MSARDDSTKFLGFIEYERGLCLVFGFTDVRYEGVRYGEIEMLLQYPLLLLFMLALIIPYVFMRTKVDDLYTF